MRELRLIFIALLFASCAGGADVNLARFCTATASSSYDHNLTAQLLTDGIVEAEMPASLEVESSQEGLIGRVERENCLDGDVNSRNIITGTSGWIAFRPYGYAIEADRAEVLYQEALAGGRGGPQMTVSLPVEIDSTGAMRLTLTFPHEGRWRVKDVAFSRQGAPVTDVLPSEHFSSAWMSCGGEEEWVQVDLGVLRRVNAIRPHWLQEPDSYIIEVSRDGEKWREVSGGCRGRFVRVRMKGSGQRICMTELEVLGPETGTGAGRSSAAGTDGWRLCRASEAPEDGAQIASASFDASSWLPATVPGTVLASFIRAGAVPDPDYGDNWEQISESYFNSDFWYRKDLGGITPAEGRRAILQFDGINWKADVWLNGQRLGDIQGAFIRKDFDITPYLGEHNILAVRIHRNAHPGAVKEKTARWTGYNGGILGADSPTFLCSIGWDWLTTVRGRNIGIWDAVRVVEKGPVRVTDPVVVAEIPGQARNDVKGARNDEKDSRDKPWNDEREARNDEKGAWNDEKGIVNMTASVQVKGVCGEAEVEGWIGDIHFSKPVSEDGEVVFDPAEFPQLRDQEMSLWWPNEYGEPTLYDAGFVVKTDGVVSDSLRFKAGIREITWDEQDGALRLFVNGRRLVPLGGNWGFSQQNLLYGPEQYDAAISYHRQMHFNMIRNWVGQVADEAFYEACDRYGILVWQEFPLANPADGPDPSDEAMFLSNATDRVLRLRRHPSIALWCGRNEGFPPLSLDGSLSETVRTLHPGIPYLSSSADGSVSGHGPYHALSAEYYFAHQSGQFHTERGMPNVPTYESLCRMMPLEDRWPIGEMWGKHDFTEVGAQKTTTYREMMSDAFGECASAEEYTALAQWINYDGYRAMFESANAGGRMGLFLWMSHAAWPSLVFCTYDYYFEPGGAFFGCKKACEPLHIQYNALIKQVEVVNLCRRGLGPLTASARIFGYRGNLISEHTASVDSPEDSTVPVAFVNADSTNSVNADPTNPVIADLIGNLPPSEPVCYLSLSLRDASGTLLSENFYILGTEPGNLQALRMLPAARLSSRMKTSGTEMTVTLRNDDTVPALLVRLILKDRGGEEILPVDYSDNYFALMPGEEKTVTVRWKGPEAVQLDITQLGDYNRKLF